MNSTELIVTKHETSVTSRPHSQFYPCVTHHHHHHHCHHPTVNQWRCWSDSSLVTLVVVVVVVIITTDDDDQDWQSRDCEGKTSTRREQLLFCANLSRTSSRPGVAGVTWCGTDRLVTVTVRKSLELSWSESAAPGRPRHRGQSDHHDQCQPVPVTVESGGLSPIKRLIALIKSTRVIEVNTLNPIL